MNDLSQIKKEIDEIKIKIGVEESLIKKKRSNLKKLKIIDLSTAQRVLKQSEIKVKNLRLKYDKLEKMISNKLEEMEN